MDNIYYMKHLLEYDNYLTSLIKEGFNLDALDSLDISKLEEIGEYIENLTSASDNLSYREFYKNIISALPKSIANEYVYKGKIQRVYFLPRLTAKDIANRKYKISSSFGNRDYFSFTDSHKSYPFSGSLYVLNRWLDGDVNMSTTSNGDFALIMEQKATKKSFDMSRFNVEVFKYIYEKYGEDPEKYRELEMIFRSLDMQVDEGEYEVLDKISGHKLVGIVHVDRSIEYDTDYPEKYNLPELSTEWGDTDLTRNFYIYTPKQFDSIWKNLN